MLSSATAASSADPPKKVSTTCRMAAARAVCAGIAGM
jgi:hypothetical protein